MLHIEIPILDGKTVEPPTVSLRYATGTRQGSEPSQTQSDELLASGAEEVVSCHGWTVVWIFLIAIEWLGLRQILIHLDL
jgi:hypothetical protein